MEAIPANIHEGMTVCDSAMEEIGTIAVFRIGDEDPSRPGPETAGVSAVVEQDRDTPAARLAHLFTPGDKVPEEMQQKALRDGFIRLDAAGLFAADRYIFPEHIDRVDGDRLVLSVRKQDLLKV